MHAFRCETAKWDQPPHLWVKFIKFNVKWKHLDFGCSSLRITDHNARIENVWKRTNTLCYFEECAKIPMIQLAVVCVECVATVLLCLRKLSLNGFCLSFMGFSQQIRNRVGLYSGFTIGKSLSREKRNTYAYTQKTKAISCIYILGRNCW